MGSIEDFGADAQAMENLAEEPFAGIRASALGEVLRSNAAGERCDFFCFSHPGMVFPKPGHGCGIFCEATVESQWAAVGVHGQGSAAGRVNADADDLVGLEPTDSALSEGDSFFESLLRALYVI